MKKCTKCGIEHELNMFYAMNRTKDGLAGHCKECMKKNAMEWSKNNKERAYLLGKRWRENNRAKILEYRKVSTPKKWKDLPLDKRIAHNMRTRLKKLVKNGKLGKTRGTPRYLGCTSIELVQHIESLWSKGMSWENYGLHGWHIDHIRPLCSFDLTIESEQKKAFNYKNLQPLWAKDNLSKGRRKFS